MMMRALRNFSLLAAVMMAPAVLTPAFATPALQGGFVRVGERLDRVPPPAPGTPSLTPDLTQSTIVSHLQTLFDKAANPSTHLMTKQGALSSGWGWAASHFGEIDRQNKGAVSFGDVLDYLNGHSNSPMILRPVQGT
ncbi:hypothetical protein [Paraburkholderia megapolitana]|uniref:EF-hand domain-containing protein n=1 Tax=Paraburkholderia megapolitana TaxID=420953 RepID=A0A1I3MPH5_9BURK|nr:hypothetical protein [Paraburkholderia megapolitana]QDQ84087.1 hypothetical protein FNZ07_23475 [Paraburkholderia megapolitana]SFI98883.1 hypothetical protein SAMN05192543_10554 [Paraburkholderia megapolitana]